MASGPKKVAPGSLQNIMTGGHFFCYFGSRSIVAYGKAWKGTSFGVTVQQWPGSIRQFGVFMHLGENMGRGAEIPRPPIFVRWQIFCHFVQSGRSSISGSGDTYFEVLSHHFWFFGS